MRVKGTTGYIHARRKQVHKNIQFARIISKLTIKLSRITEKISILTKN